MVNKSEYLKQNSHFRSAVYTVTINNVYDIEILGFLLLTVYKELMHISTS